MIGKRLGPHKWLLPFALAVAVWQVVPIFLMSAERSFYKNHFPAYFNSWTYDGSFSVLDNFSAWEDTYQYAARIRDAGSHALPGDPYIKGNRGAAIASRDFVVFYALGWIFRLTGDIRATYTATNFLFGLIWVLTIYAVLLRTGAKHEASLFVAVFTTLFADLGQQSLEHLLHARGFVMLVQYLLWPLGSYHYWFGPSRLYRPQFTIPCLLLAALAWVRADKKQSWPWALTSGLAGGALAYVHLDVWAVYIGATALFSAYAGYRRRLSVKTAASLAATLLVSLPAFLLVAAIKKNAGGAGTGIEYGHAPNLGALPFLAGAWAAYRYFKNEPMILWIGSALAAAFALSNLQVVTGWSLGTGHAIMTGNYFLALLVGRWLTGRVAWPKSAWLWLSALALTAALPRLVSFSALHYKIYALPRADEEAYQWLDRNTPPDAVVGALSPMTYMRLPVHTHDKTLVSFAMPIISDIPAKENARRLVYALSLYGAKLDDYAREAQDVSGRWGEKLWLGIADGPSRERSGTFSAHFWNTPPEDCVALLREAARDPGPAAYEADYLWMGSFEKSLASGRGPDPVRWKKVFENPGVTLYRRTGPGA